MYSPIMACNATTIIKVCRRPYSSDSVPLDNEPIAAPAKKHISMKCSSVASSHTTFHSDWMVVSLISESNTKRVHFSISMVLLPCIDDVYRFSSASVRFFAIMQAPCGWDKFRHSASDKFNVGSSSEGIAHQKSRSTAYLPNEKERNLCVDSQIRYTQNRIFSIYDENYLNPKLICHL